MKLGYLFYWCGWGAIVLAFIFIGMGIFTEEGFSTFAIAKAISGFIIGGLWIGIGAKKIQRAKLEEFEKMRQLGFKGSLEQFEELKQLIAFQKENCVGCRFADEEAMRNSQKWCIRPEPPECDKQYCYSREVKQ